MHLVNYPGPNKNLVLALIFGAGCAISQPDTTTDRDSAHGVPRQIIINPFPLLSTPVSIVTSVANSPSTPFSAITPTPIVNTPSYLPIPNPLSSITESSVSNSNAGTTTSLQSSPTPTISASSSATPETADSLPLPTVKLVYLVPAFSVIGVLLIGSVIWFTYGCCTRRPKMRRSNSDLIGGPRYIGLRPSERTRDVEEGHGGLGYGNKDLDVPEMKERHHRKGGRGKLNTEFRWPSIRRGERPGFDPVKGFHVPEEYVDENDPFLSLPLAPMHPEQVKRTTTRVTKITPGSDAPSKTQDSALSPRSDTTSLALLELYESDDEAIAERRKKETPWESLRHKSIKRGIIENVIKENKWMDSIRGALSGLGGQGKSGEMAGLMAGAEDDVITPPQRARPGINKRRGHLRMNSDLCIDNGTSAPRLRVINKQHTQSTDATVSPTISESEWLKGNSPPRPKPESPVVTPKGHRTFAWLKDEDSQDKFTPVPARLSQSRSPSRRGSRSRSRTRSTSPIRQRSPTVVRDGDLTERGPSQIRSPPLESQMRFTPIPIPIAKLQSSRNLRPKIRTRASSNNGPIERRLHLTESPPLPSPDREGLLFDFQGNRLADPEDRDMVMMGGEDSFHSALSVMPASTTFRTEEEAEGADESLMKKVEQIMETSWGMREEMEREAITRNGLGVHD